jgi:hypothetical protein
MPVLSSSASSTFLIGVEKWSVTPKLGETWTVRGADSLKADEAVHAVDALKRCQQVLFVLDIASVNLCASLAKLLGGWFRWVASECTDSVAVWMREESAGNAAALLTSRAYNNTESGSHRSGA